VLPWDIYANGNNRSEVPTHVLALWPGALRVLDQSLRAQLAES
ncbi:MAG: hypothetical protein JWP25_4479, partial [Bradyrhizobium sp.]|nr:hypothetical protein [Bradyrhizobium sp.]